MDKLVQSESQKKLIDMWYIRVTAAQKCHYLASARYAKYNYFLGIPSMILSAIIGTTIFASIISQLSSALTLCIGLGSMLVVLLSSLQTFLSFNERSEKHRQFGASYGIVGRKLELLNNTNEILESQILEAIRQELDDLADEAPRIPLNILSNVKKTVINYEDSFGPIIDKV